MTFQKFMRKNQAREFVVEVFTSKKKFVIYKAAFMVSAE
jgi:hypothetical protein